MPKARILFLDSSTVDLNDLDMRPLERTGSYRSLPLCHDRDIMAKAAGADVLITNKCLLTWKRLEALPDLKLICLAATGVNNVDLKAAKERGIAVTNVAGYSTQTVAEHTLLFLLSFAHRLLEHHEAAVSGPWVKSPHFTVLDFPFAELKGKTLGLVGYGQIGKKVAKLAKAFGMVVWPAAIPGRKYGMKRRSLNSVLKKSDYVSLHCPLTDKTRHLINRRSLSLMKKGAVLINMARGPVVDEEAVAAALRRGKLRGYGTDVLEREPPLKNNPLLDKRLKSKILMTPHVAWASREARQALVDEIALNIRFFLKGKKRNRIV